MVEYEGKCTVRMIWGFRWLNKWWELQRSWFVLRNRDNARELGHLWGYNIVINNNIIEMCVFGGYESLYFTWQTGQERSPPSLDSSALSMSFTEWVGYVSSQFTNDSHIESNLLQIWTQVLRQCQLSSEMSVAIHTNHSLALFHVLHQGWSHACKQGGRSFNPQSEYKLIHILSG